MQLGENWVTNMVGEEWNKLSKNVVSIRTVDNFKKRFDIRIYG